MGEVHEFAPGTRVRNYGDQYAKAIMYGTATVIDFRQSRGTFIEYRVRRDNPLPGCPDTTWWPAHRTFRATDATPPRPPEGAGE